MQSAVEIKNVFEDYQRKNEFITGHPQSLYDPINYILSLNAKRARPIMLLLGEQLYGSQIENGLPAALAVEIFHNFTLLHDDIMDEAPMRRGQPAVHIKYDTNAAILSGDAMMILANQYMRQTVSAHKLYIHELFDAAALAICEGQQMDMDFEISADVTIEDYIEMIRKKTAVLLGVSLEIGALIGGATVEEAKKLYQFGEQFGISFQIQDDLLDSFGDQQKVGKQTGGDILQGKKTYLYLKTKELLEGVEQQSFVDQYASLDAIDKVDRIKSLFKRVGADEYARQLRDAYHDLAFSHLHALNLSTDRLKPITEYTNTFITRQS